MKRAILAVAAVTFLLVAGAAMAADTNTVTVTASVTGTCKFSSPTSTLGFGALDPSSSADATATTSVSFWCTKGTTATLTDDDGLHKLVADGNRMQHQADSNEYIPYSFSYTPSSLTGSGPNVPTTLTITGTITNAEYVDALAGSYSDTVVVSFDL
jgi:spore coat protein U-like protein